MIVRNEVKIEENLSPEAVSPAIQKMIEENKLMIFMKGNSMVPQCGFSAQVIEIFKQLNAEFSTFNVLDNMSVREGVKSFSNWPTIPQVYFQGKFLGGCDIVTEMYQKGELDALMKG